jgi:hypothetical protein
MESTLTNVLNLDALRHATLFRQPFSFLVAHGVVQADALASVRADFPVIERPGLFPLSELSYGPFFGALIDDLLGPQLERVLGEALDVDLSGRARLVTVRGHCRERDGQIHNDSADKLVSLLLYLNDDAWDAEGGRLRFLRDPLDIDSVVAEVPPTAGTLVAFRRSENSWHGHRPFAGARRYVMINWMAQPIAAKRELARHRLTARLKSITGWL